MSKGYTGILHNIEKQVAILEIPYVTKLSQYKRSPFRVLVSCILSLRTKDIVTAHSSERLFKVVKEPKDILGISLVKIEKLIYPSAFYHNKAKTLKGIAQRLVSKEEYHGKVPMNLEELLSFKGIGRKDKFYKV